MQSSSIFLPRKQEILARKHKQEKLTLSEVEHVLMKSVWVNIMSQKLQRNEK